MARDRDDAHERKGVSDRKTDGRSDIDQGAYDDGNPGPREPGEGVYLEQPGRQGEGAVPEDETLGQTPDGSAQADKAHNRGADGGRARGNQYGNNGGEKYGGGGAHGGTRGDPERPTP